jgi:MFS family permease
MTHSSQHNDISRIVPLAIAVFLIMMPVTMLVPVLKELLSDRLGASNFITHAFMSVNMIGALIAAPAIGRLSDRCGRKRIVIFGAALNAVLLWAMGRTTDVTLMLVLRGIEGMSHIAVLTTLMAQASDWATPGRRGRAMGTIGACLMLGTAVGSPLGGVIGRHAPNAVFLWGGVISIVVAIVGVLFIHDAARSPSGTTIGPVQLLKRRRGLAVPFAYAFIDRFCVGVIVSTFMLYLADTGRLDPAERGLLVALFMLPFAILCYPVGRLVDRVGAAWPLAGGSLLFGCVFATYGFVPVGWLAAVMVVSGVLSATMFAPNLTLCADLATEHDRGTVFAGFNAAGALGFICGPLFGGALSSMLVQVDHHYAIVMAAAGATEVLCAALTLPWLLRQHRQSHGSAVPDYAAVTG